MGVGGLRILSDALKVNTALTTLDVQGLQLFSGFGRPMSFGLIFRLFLQNRLLDPLRRCASTE